MVASEGGGGFRLRWSKSNLRCLSSLAHGPPSQCIQGLGAGIYQLPKGIPKCFSKIPSRSAEFMKGTDSSGITQQTLGFRNRFTLKLKIRCASAMTEKAFLILVHFFQRDLRQKPTPSPEPPMPAYYIAGRFFVERSGRG